MLTSDKNADLFDSVPYFLRILLQIRLLADNLYG